MAESFITEHGLGWILVIAAVLVLAVFFLVIIAQNLDIVPSLNRLFQGGGTPPAPEAVVLQSAVKCSYYRCSDGCGSNEIKKLKSTAFDCSDFCKAEWTDTGNPDGKICDDNARAHPVTAIVTSTSYDGEKISLDGLKFAACMVQTDTCTPFSGPAKFVFIQKDIINENTQTTINCGPPASGYRNGFSAAVITPGHYEIWTTSGLGSQATFICSP